jgi:predicted transcriptional regulator
MGERAMEISFTDRELDIMNVLWDRGSATVAEVRESLSDDLAYTTVLTMLRILQEKGHVRYEEEGRAHRYFPLVERQAVRTSAVRRLTRRLFQDSPELLLTQLVADEGLSDEDVRRIRKLLDDRLKVGE